MLEFMMGGAQEKHYRNEPILYCNDKTSVDLIPDYCIIYGVAEGVPESFSGQFDVCVSIASFEHITHLPIVMNKIHATLVPGGELLSVFSPIWSSKWGHHTWVYQHNGQTYDDGAQFLPAWGHLLMTPSEMYAHLLQYTTHEKADDIVYKVYHSENLNRYFVEDYQNICKTLPFRVTNAIPNTDAEVPEETLQTLKARYPGRENFSATALTIYAVK